MMFLKFEHKLIIGFILFIISIIIGTFTMNEPKNEIIKCNSKNEMLEQSFDGVILYKGKNKENHNFETIYLDEQGRIREVITVNEKSGFFKIVSKGDNIKKLTNELKVRIIREDTIIHSLNYDCE
jgi:hypothetical protein